MGDKLKFPVNGSVYFKKGAEAFEQGRKEEAIDYLRKAVELLDDREVNYYFAFVLFYYHKYEEALTVLDKKKEEYINNEDHASFYTGLLIRNNQFLEAEYIIQKYQLDPKTNYDEVWKQLEQELDKKRVSYNLNKKMEGKDLIQSLELLAECSSAVQMQKIKEAQVLNRSELQKLAPMILTNNQLDEKTRRGFLELLVQRKDTNIYSFLWFDQVRSVCPVKLSKFTDVQTVIQLLDQLDEKLTKYPDLYRWIEAELVHDLLLLYPYIEEVVKDPDFWTDLYIMDLDLFNHVKKERIATTEDEVQMKDMVNYLHTISQRHQMLEDD